MKKQDSILGTAIGKGLQSGEGAGRCPTLEEIAALVERRVGGATRDELMGHLASCDSCRQIFVTASELTEVGAKPRGRYLVPLALAATAVLAIGLVLTRSPAPTAPVRVAQSERSPAPEPSAPGKDAAPAAPLEKGESAGEDAPPEEVPKKEAPKKEAPKKKDGPNPTVARMAHMLARTGDPRQMAPLTGPGSKGYGFAANGDTMGGAFRAGMNAMDLEVALLAGDVERAQGAALRAGSLLQGISGDEGIANLERLVERLETGEKPESLAGSSSVIEEAIPRRKKAYARLGAWAEGARMAAKTGNAAFFAGGVPAHFKEKFVMGPLPPKAKSVLRQIDLKVKGKKEIDFRSLEQSLEELIGAF